MENNELNYILGGDPINAFNSEPTYGDVLRFYAQFWGKNESDTKKESRVSSALKNFYTDRNVETLHEFTIRRKIRTQIMSLRKILRFKSKEKTQSNIRMENAFRAQLSNIFQIGKPTVDVDYVVPMDVEESIGSHSASDHYLSDGPGPSFVGGMQEDVRRNSNENVPFPAKDFDDSDYNPSSPDDSSDEEKAKKDIPEDILWELFNTGVPFRSLSKVLELAFSLFNGTQKYNFSYSYLFQKYQKLSIAKENAYKTRIRSENVFGTICFDHQKMQELSNKFATQKDRLGIVWHSEDRDRIIAVKEMPNKAGLSQAVAILESCDEFDIVNDQIVAVSCDNATTNVGYKTGTCALVEDKLQKPLLRLMCNHHITEIVIKDVYHHLFSTDTPNNLFYPILKEQWMQLREENFPYAPFEEQTYTENLFGLEQEIFDELKENALASMRNQLASPSIRDDYKELNILGMKFFGERFNYKKRNQVKFYALINPSNARFMGTAIQALKAYLFRDSLDWNSPAREKIRQDLEVFVIFIVLIYIPLWNGSNILFDAAVNTIECLKKLEKLSHLYLQIASVAKVALCRHLSYLSEELSPLAIFSNKISCEEKNEITAKLMQFDSVNLPPRKIGPNEHSNHIAYSENIEFGELERLDISKLIGGRSHYLFNIMKINTDFLRCDAETWSTNNQYLNARNIISKSLICVNDNSERVFAASKHRITRQRCKKNDSYIRSMFATSYKQ